MNALHANGETGTGDEALAQLVRQLLENSPPPLADLIRRAALPRLLDEGVMGALYPESEDAAATGAASFAAIQQFRFVRQVYPGQLIYHDNVRAYLLEEWANDQPVLFRQLCQRLAEYYLNRSGLPGETPQAVLPEWIYHLLAADPPRGIAQLDRLFERAVEARELGFAERLASTAKEREAFLDGQAGWLDYFRGSLALANSEHEAAIDSFSTVVTRGQDDILTATTRRGLAQALLSKKEWSRSIEELQHSLRTFQRVHDTDNIIRTHMALGDVYRDMAQSCGGIYDEQPEFAGGFHHTAYVALNLPFLLYRRLARRLDFVPSLHGASYQNWIIIRLLGLALRAYRRAERMIRRVHDERLSVEVQQRLADTDLDLGHPGRAAGTYRALSAMPLVQSSAYRTARADLGLARIAVRQGARVDARERYTACLITFQRFGDWHNAGEAAYEFGQLLEAEGRAQEAVEVYSSAIAASSKAADYLRRTEIAVALGKLISNAGTAVDEAHRAEAEEALGRVDRLAYIARFPGRVQLWFTRLSQTLTGPVLFWIALILAVLSSVPFIYLEGQLRTASARSAVPLGTADVAILTLEALLPLLAIWLRHLLYVILGWAFVQFLLPVARVENSQPDIYILNDSGIVRHGKWGGKPAEIAWSNIESIIIADRCVWRHPTALLSRTFITGAGQVLVVSGTTNHYPELQRAIEAHRRRAQPDASPSVQCGLSIVSHWWFWTAWALALALAGMLIRAGAYQIYCTAPRVNGVCPAGYELRLAVAPWATWTMILFVIVFAAGTVVRMARAGQCVRRALRGG